MSKTEINYTASTNLNPGDELASYHPEWTSPVTGITTPAREYVMTVANPAYDEKDRVCIVEECHGKVLGNRNAAPGIRRYKRNSKKLMGRNVRSAS